MFSFLVLRPNQKRVVNESNLIKEASILSNIIDKALLRDFNIKASKEEPSHIITLENGFSGQVLCQIEECKKRHHKQAVTRTVKRAWSTQNFYRHVRAAHFDTKKLKLSENDIDDPNHGDEFQDIDTDSEPDRNMSSSENNS